MCGLALSAKFKTSGQISLYIDMPIYTDDAIAPIQRMLEYSGANLKLGELHVEGDGYYLPLSLEKPVGVLATKAKKVYLEGITINKLEGDSPSNITTLKHTGGAYLDDVSDDILSNIEEFEGTLFNTRNDE